MDETWVRSTLAPHIDGDSLVLATYPDGSRQTVEIVTFVDLFGSVTVPVTHAKLVAADGGKGYTGFFDQWKAEGLIA